VVQPQNHKWADYEESKEWKFFSATGLPTYGTCEFCLASGPAYKQCAHCTLDEYQIVYRKDFILDSQALSKKMGKPQETAKANCTQSWIKTDGIELTESEMYLMMQSKNRQIEEIDKMRTMVKQDLSKFLHEYEFVLRQEHQIRYLKTT
jgi:hypothetical protein